ncbi:CAP domain-containing protein [Geothrix mesophila]|uniref:CAP domain-containing protein n=1 Tax=Geothrix mesophila TaxID=2922723 RepID=UPI001FABBC9C|nr:CAP domain-containing protein [Geothrix sp. SG198]
MRIAVLFLAALLCPIHAVSGEPAKATAFERAVVQEMSDVRVRPKTYAKYLRELRPYFEGTLWSRPGRVPLRTEEGVAALDEAIAFLESARPVGPLRFNEGLARAARLHARDIGPKGSIEHTGSDGSRLTDRLNRLGRWQGLIAENISAGEDEARQVVIQLLIDDGVASRGHRKNLFNPDLHQAGAGSAPHRDYRTVTVIDYADGFVENR